MREELDKKLCEKYPGIFRDRNGKMSETCMVWGFPGDGWYDLIDELCSQLKLIESASGIKVIANQVKEKFGTLRFYFSIDPESEIKCSDEEARLWQSLIERTVGGAENSSGHRCEICGEYGSEDSGGTARTHTFTANKIADGLYQGYVKFEDLYSPRMITSVQPVGSDPIPGTAMAHQVDYDMDIPDKQERERKPKGYHITVALPLDTEQCVADELTFEIEIFRAGWVLTLCRNHREIREKMTKAGIPFAVYNDNYAKYVDEDMDDFIDVFNKTHNLPIDLEEALNADKPTLAKMIEEAQAIMDAAKAAEIPEHIARTFESLDDVKQIKALADYAVTHDVTLGEVYQHSLKSNEDIDQYAADRDKRVELIQYAESKGIDPIDARMLNFKEQDQVDKYVEEHKDEIQAELKAKADAAKPVEESNGNPIADENE